MGNYENLKQSITEVIKTNGNQEITGAVLQSTLLTIISTVGANATFAGIATPTTNPGTPDGHVFYLASESGTYTNFNAIELQDGLSILMWNGSWRSQQIFGVDDVPTVGSNNLAKSKGVYNNIGAFDIYELNATENPHTLATYEDLTSALTALPTSYRKGGMSVKFVQSSNNKYAQYILMADNFSIVPSDWQKIENINQKFLDRDAILFDFDEIEAVGNVEDSKNAQTSSDSKVKIVDGTSEYKLLTYNINGESFFKCKCTSYDNTDYGVGVYFTDSDNNILGKWYAKTYGTYIVVLSVPDGAAKVYVNGINLIPTCTSGTLSNTPSYKAEVQQCREKIQHVDSVIFDKIQPLYGQYIINGESVGTVTNGKNAQHTDSNKVYIADDSSIYNLLQYTLNGEKYLKCYCSASSSVAYGAGVIFADDNDNILSQYNNQVSGNYNVILSVPGGATKVYINGINIIPTCVSQNLVKTPIYSEEIKVLDEKLLETEYIDAHLGTVENTKQAQVINDNQLHIGTGDQSYNLLTYTLNNEISLKCKYSAGPDKSYAVGVIFVDGDNKILFKQNEDTQGTHSKTFSVPVGATKVYVNGVGGLVPECILATTQKSFSFEYFDYISPKISLSLFENIGVIGDSYASGELYYNNDFHDKYNISWGQQIARKFGIRCINFSSGGLSTRSWLTAAKGLPKLLNDPAQDLYLLVLGINDYYSLGINYLGTIEDITSHESYTDYGDTFYGNYGKIIEQTLQHAPNAKLVMFGLAATAETAITFNNAIREIATHYNIPYINQKDDDFYKEAVYTNMSGGHPTAIGYARMAIAFERLLSKCILENIQYFSNYKMYD